MIVMALPFARHGQSGRVGDESRMRYHDYGKWSWARLENTDGGGDLSMEYIVDIFPYAA